MPTKPRNDEPDETGKPDAATGRAGERARDEQREGGPRYGGTRWTVADQRGARRFGQARNDDSDPSELDRGSASDDNDEWPGSDSTPQAAAAGEPVTGVGGEAGGQRAGFGRGEKPSKTRSRLKKNPRSGTKKKS